MKEKIKICLITFFLLCVSSGCGEKQMVYFEATETVTTELAEENDTEAVTEPTEENSGGLCYVFVCGAVTNPGVYRLPEKSRVYEAIEMAGGILAEASEESVNQADYLQDGQMIKILTKEEMSSRVDNTSDCKEPEDGRLDINKASASELMTLPGVGQSKAESIVTYREANGMFSKAEDIMKVDGIKEGVFNRIKEYIKVN